MASTAPITGSPTGATPYQQTTDELEAVSLLLEQTAACLSLGSNEVGSGLVITMQGSVALDASETILELARGKLSQAISAFYAVRRV